MYVDVANMTLGEVKEICEALNSARLDTYITKVGRTSYLYTVDRQKCD